MCVWASINPGNPVYFERSTISTPGGIADASVVTLRIRSPSMITIAFVQSFPLASHNFPKRTALTVFASGFAWARRPVAQKPRRKTARHIRVSFIRQNPPYAQTLPAQRKTSNSVVAEMQSRTVEIYCWRRAVCDGEDFPVEE